MSEKNIRFSKLLELHVTNVISKKFVNEAATTDMFKEVRETVRQTIEGVFMKSSHTLTPSSMTWLSDQFFKAIKINGDASMGDLVIIKETKLADLPYHDIELMRNLFNETGLAFELEEEYRTRSTS